MNTHAAASKRWTASELGGLAVEDNFRLRGLEVTRLDTFVDAAFAFVLTLLVISFDEIPSSSAEMLAAAKRVPGFAASFAVLMMFWLKHRHWSRRYGLENSTTIFYSLTLIFVMLVYVYPLRMIFEGLFANLSNNFLPTSYQLETYDELRLIFVFYSVGFLALSLLICQLYRAAIRNAMPLALNEIELQETKIEVRDWALATGFGLLSILLAYTLPDAWIQLAGYIYVFLVPVQKLLAILVRRRGPDSSPTVGK